MRLTTRGNIETGMAIWAAVGVFWAFVIFTWKFLTAYFSPDKISQFPIDKVGEANLELVWLVSVIICVGWTLLRYIGFFKKKHAVATGKTKEKLK